MTPAEHRLLLLALAWILASVPLALLAFQVWFKPRLQHPVIPPADAGPAGSFLDVALPALPPLLPETGIPLRQWKPVDGWVALGLVLILTFLMGPLASGPGDVQGFTLNADVMLMQIIFQFSLGSLVLFYLKSARGLVPAKIFGWGRQPWWKVPLLAVLWLVPGLWVVGLLHLVTMPWVLQWLGQTESSTQLIVGALQQKPDLPVQVLVALSVAVGAPFMEEIIFRGFLYSVARRFTHWSYAALGSSLFFAIVHGNVMSFLPLTCLGLIFTAAYEQSKSLWVPMLMHGSFNLLQIIQLFYGQEISGLTNHG